MKTLQEFLVETHNQNYPDSLTWGVIHPKTGKLISGNTHPTAWDHESLKNALYKKNPKIKPFHYGEYARERGYSSTSPDSLNLRTNKHNKEGVLKAWNNLPHSISGVTRIDHGFTLHDNNTNEVKTAKFDNPIKAYNFLRSQK